MRPVLVVALLFQTIDALLILDVVLVPTRGGPGGEKHFEVDEDMRLYLHPARFHLFKAESV